MATPVYKDFDRMQPLGMAQDFVEDNKFERGGVRCPCCKRVVATYDKRIGSGRAYALVRLIEASDGGKRWAHWRDFDDTRNFTILEHWGMVKSKPNDNDPTRRGTGYWKPTEKGMRFAMGQSIAPAYARFDDNVFVGFSEEQTDIDTELGEKFDFREIHKKVTIAIGRPLKRPIKHKKLRPKK